MIPTFGNITLQYVFFFIKILRSTQIMFTNAQKKVCSIAPLRPASWRHSLIYNRYICELQWFYRLSLMQFSCRHNHHEQDLTTKHRQLARLSCQPGLNGTTWQWRPLVSRIGALRWWRIPPGTCWWKQPHSSLGRGGGPSSVHFFTVSDHNSTISPTGQQPTGCLRRQMNSDLIR